MTVLGPDGFAHSLVEYARSGQASDDWNQTVAPVAHKGGERAELYREFWGEFLARLHEDRPLWTRANQPLNTNWITLRSGTSGVLFGSNFRQIGLCSEILFEGPPAETNSARFQAFMSYRAVVDAEFGAGLEWEDLAGVKRCRVATYRGEASIEDRSSWPEFIDWFIDSQDRLRSAYRVFGRGAR